MAHNVRFEARYWIQMNLPGSGRAILPIVEPTLLYIYCSPNGLIIGNEIAG